MENEKRHPIALFCDEAHLYIPANLKGGMEEKGLQSYQEDYLQVKQTNHI
jgi:hypothetical protein